MMRGAWLIARRDLLSMLRAKETLLWGFLMPVVFVYFIGNVTSGSGGGVGVARIALETEDEGPLVARVQRHLEARGYEVLRTGDEGFDALSRRVILPPDFSAEVLGGVENTVRFRRDSDGLAADYDDLKVQRAVYTVLADVVAARRESGGADEASLAALDALPRRMTVAVEPAGERRHIPQGIEQTVPGILVMFTLLVLCTSGAVLLVIERNQGVLRRLASTPLRRGEVVLGKWLGKMVLGLVQIAFAMLAGTVLFDMDWGPRLPSVSLVLLAWAALCASVGLLLGVVASTEGQAVGVGVLAANVLGALGGCWWPIEVTPPWMQSLQKLLPTGWAMDALHKLVSFQLPPSSVIPHVLGMSAAALVLGWVGARRFRFV